jgi:hypothetical protein
LIVALIPIPAWQDRRLDRHVRICPHCRARLAGRAEVKALLFREDEIGEIPDFWPRVKAAVESRETSGFAISRPSRGKRLRILAAALGAVVLLLIVGRLMRRPGSSPAGETAFRLHEIHIDDRPARAYLFQPQDSNMVFIWAEKTQEGGSL